MLVARKDDLRIEVLVSGQKVLISMPGMEDVLFLWNSWIKREEQLAESVIRSQFVQNPYAILVRYFSANGWHIDNMDKIVHE
jgi:hypothetical protein